MRQTQLSASVLASIVLIAFSNAIVHANASIGKLYWSFNSPGGLQSVLIRSNLDGSGAQSLLENSSGGDRPIALDLTSGFLYAGYSGRITRYDLDGGNPTVIFNTTTNPSGISGIAVDAINDKLYWSFNSPGGLQSVLMRSNLDGSGAQSLLESSSGGDRPIALDLTSGFLYAGYSGRITRYDLDGGNPTVIFNTTTNPSGISGIALIPVPEPAGISLLFVGATGILAMLRRAKEHAHLVIIHRHVQIPAGDAYVRVPHGIPHLR